MAAPNFAFDERGEKQQAKPIREPWYYSFLQAATPIAMKALIAGLLLWGIAASITFFRIFISDDEIDRSAEFRRLATQNYIGDLFRMAVGIVIVVFHGAITLLALDAGRNLRSIESATRRK